MDDWDYCQNTLPKVSRTFALNIAVLKGRLHRSVLTGYLFCRIVDTVEDAGQLEANTKIKLLLEFAQFLQDADYRATALPTWIEKCRVVDGNPNDLELLSQTSRVFNIFDSLPTVHKETIVPSVIKMAQGMAYFQNKFDADGLTLLETENELEEYCYFVAGCVGEMLCGLFFAAIPQLSAKAKEIMQLNAVSFGLGLQMTNISKDVITDRKRGWSYIPRTMITGNGLTVDEFSSGQNTEKDQQVIKCLLRKTSGHLQDALKFTLALPRTEYSIRLFCIWPLWMAMETVAVLVNNRSLLSSEDPIKISRSTVKKILRRTPLFCFSNFFLKRSFGNIVQRCNCGAPPPFDFQNLQQRLGKIPLDPPALYA